MIIQYSAEAENQINQINNILPFDIRAFKISVNKWIVNEYKRWHNESERSKEFEVEGLAKSISAKVICFIHETNRYIIIVKHVYRD